jgi:hypothetical protein
VEIQEEVENRQDQGSGTENLVEDRLLAGKVVHRVGLGRVWAFRGRQVLRMRLLDKALSNEVER